MTVEIPPGKFYRRARPPSLNGFEWTAGSDEEVWYRRFDECEHEDDPPTPPRWPRSWSGAADAAKDVVIPPSPPRSSYSPSSFGKNAIGIVENELLLHNSIIQCDTYIWF